MGKKLKFEADVICTSCGGTGLYQGMAERDGAAVVCYQCDGTGKQHVTHTYEEFEKRKLTKKVTRVFKTAGGFGITTKDITREKDGLVVHFSQAGATYEDWQAGKELLPIRELHCPVVHFGQGTGIGEWFKGHMGNRDKSKLKGDCPECDWEFTKCSATNKSACWAFYDAHKKEFDKLKD